MPEIAFTSKSDKIAELQIAIAELRKDLDKGYFHIRTNAEDIQRLEADIDALSRIVHERISVVDNKIDSKMDWVVKLIGSAAIAVIVNLAWIVTTNSQITVSSASNTESAKQ